MKKFIIALATVVVLSVPAFADNEVYFANPLEFDYANGVATLSSNGNVYFCAITYSYNSAFSSIVAFSTIQDASYTLVDNGVTYTLNCSSDAGDGVYFSWAITSRDGSTFDPTITRFPSNYTVAMMAEEYLDFLANQPTPTPTGNPVTVHVPYGNVLYIKVDQRQENIKLVAHMPKLSFLIPDSNFGYWGETGICWGDYNTLPYSGLTFPLNGMTGIDWQRDSSRNILGQTKTGVATKIMNTGVWYALFCPSLFGHFDLDSSSALPGASVDVTGVFSDIRLYPLSDTYSFVDAEVINGSDSEYHDYFDGTPTETGTVTWTDQDGNVSAPRAGGSSYVPEAETAESLISQIKNILSNIVKELQSLFTFGYDAIQTLVNLMSDFVSGFSQLYTWLPAPVYSVIISAVTIAIVIGVFKVFL